MATYNEIKNRYEQDQNGMQQGLQQAGSSARTVSGAVQARDDELFVNGAAEGVGTLIGLGIRSARMSQQNAKIEAINQAMTTCSTQMDQGLHDEVIATATKQLVSNEIVEARVQGHFYRGAAYCLSGQYIKAIEDLTEAIRIIETSQGQLDRDALGDTHASSYYFRGEAFEKQNQPSDALRDLTRAIQLAPGWEGLYYSRSRVLRAIGEYDRALSDINQAVAIQPGDADNYRERGRLYALTGAPDRAVDDFTRAITLHRSAANFRARGMFYADQKEQARALTDYSAALAFDPNDVETFRLRAALFESLGAHAEAQADRTHAAESEKRHSTFRSYLDKAKAVYEKGITKTWTEADTRAKPNYPVAILLGVLTFIGSAVALTFVAGLSGGGDTAGLCLLVALVLTPVFGVAVTIDRIKSPKQQAKDALQYFEEIAACEEQMPRFSEFFEAFLKARSEGTLPKLRENTQSLFEQTA